MRLYRTVAAIALALGLAATAGCTDDHIKAPTASATPQLASGLAPGEPAVPDQTITGEQLIAAGWTPADQYKGTEALQPLQAALAQAGAYPASLTEADKNRAADLIASTSLSTAWSAPTLQGWYKEGGNTTLFTIPTGVERSQDRGIALMKVHVSDGIVAYVTVRTTAAQLEQLSAVVQATAIRHIAQRITLTGGATSAGQAFGFTGF